MPYGEALYHLGIYVMCGAAALALVLTAILTIGGKRLKEKLNQEYGNRPHK